MFDIFNSSLERASWWNGAANMALLVSLIVGVISTYIIVVTSDVKEQHFKKDIASAYERTAQLELEATGLKIQLQQQVEKLAPRYLKPEQQETLKTMLRGKMPAIYVVTQRDLEARRFALDIYVALSEAGITIHPIDMAPGAMHYFPAGVLMYSPSGENELKSDPLYLALNKAGLYGGNASRPFASLDMGAGPNPALLPGNRHVIYIGQKNAF